MLLVNCLCSDCCLREPGLNIVASFESGLTAGESGVRGRDEGKSDESVSRIPATLSKLLPSILLRARTVARCSELYWSMRSLVVVLAARYDSS